MRSVIGWLYRHVLKPVLFRFDPEDVHDHFLRFGAWLGRYRGTRALLRVLCTYRHLSLVQQVQGIVFENPVGLAAGFDKDGALPHVIGNVGFGFSEVGSVTARPCAGNPRPRLWRLPKSQSLLVYYGLKNNGVDVLISRMRGVHHDIPIGINIARTNIPETVSEEAGIADYLYSYRKLTEAGIGEYYTINISCPNTCGGEPFTDPTKLDRLLGTLCTIRQNKPLFLKLSPELSHETLDGIVTVVGKYPIAGFICTNLAKDRSNPALKEFSIPDTGGMSGKVVQGLSDAQIAYLYRKTKGAYTIIGCGGIFTAEDAYRKIRSGATLVQLITGMIYQGPQVIGEINHGLAKLLARDGFAHLSDAVGVDAI